MLGIWLQQHRLSGKTASRSKPPLLMRMLLFAQSTMMLGVGVALFTAPTVLASFWPWKLAILTSQPVGAWLIRLGIFALHSALENDFRRIQAAMVSYLGFAILELLALLRYLANVDWTNPNAWLYLVFMSSLVVGVSVLSHLSALLKGEDRPQIASRYSSTNVCPFRCAGHCDRLEGGGIGL